MIPFCGTTIEDDRSISQKDELQRGRPRESLHWQEEHDRALASGLPIGSRSWHDLLCRRGPNDDLLITALINGTERHHTWRSPSAAKPDTGGKIRRASSRCRKSPAVSKLRYKTDWEERECRREEAFNNTVRCPVSSPRFHSITRRFPSTIAGYSRSPPSPPTPTAALFLWLRYRR